MRKDRRRKFLLASGALLAAPLVSIAQPTQRVRRIGLLSPFTPFTPARRLLFVELLRRAGYEEGRNLVIEWRFAEGNVERLAKLAEELVRLDVELIVALVNSASDAAVHATKSIPIVMWSNMFPVERGLAASLARPGGNVTGTVWWAKPRDMSKKIYQIAKEAMPKTKRSAELVDPTDPQDRFYDRQDQVRRLAEIGLAHTRIEMTRREGLNAALDTIKANHIELLYVTGGGAAIGSSYPEVIAFALEQKLASFSDNPRYVEAGGLFTYGPDGDELMSRVVSYVERILRGAKPGDLAIEQSSTYVLAFNNKTARAIGIKPPQTFMLRVDKLVE